MYFHFLPFFFFYIQIKRCWDYSFLQYPFYEFYTCSFNFKTLLTFLICTYMHSPFHNFYVFRTYTLENGREL